MAFSRLIQVRARRAFSRERRGSPNPSSTISSATSIWSPTATTVCPVSSRNCSMGMALSDFNPALTITTSWRTSTTVALTMEPGRIFCAARLCSNSCAKLSLICLMTLGPDRGRNRLCRTMRPSEYPPIRRSDGTYNEKHTTQPHGLLVSLVRFLRGFPPQRKHLHHDLVDAEARGIDDYRAGRGSQGRHTAFAVAGVPRRQFTQNVL